MALNGTIDITPDQRKTLISLLSKHLPNTVAWVYGSRIRKTSRPASDLDMVVFATPQQAREVSELRESFEESNLPFRVDLFIWDKVPESFRKEIKNSHVVLVDGSTRSGAMENSLFTRSGQRHWPSIPLGDVVGLHQEQITPSTSPDRMFAYHSIPAFDDGLRAVVESGSAIKSNKFTIPSDAVLVSRLNPRFPRVWTPEVDGDIPAICSTEFLVLQPRSIDRRFLHYSCMAPSFRTSLLARVTGTSGSHQRVSPASALEIVTPVPPVDQQRAIAHILSTLDDKIELNRRMNETLEAMARAIFKDWFVDFGPTRAKAEGRVPYLAPELWDLFPDAIDDEDKPVGWRKGILADIAVSPRRGVSPADVAENTPYIGLEHMPRRSIALTEWEGAGSVKSNKSVFKRGQFLFGKLRPYFHKVGLAPLDGICSTDIVVVVPRDPDWAAFTLACLSSDDFVDYTDQTSTGTKMPRTSWKTMGLYRMCLPMRQVAHAFQSLAHPLFDVVSTNIHESRTLAATRDLLLPKLMSGEIRLAEAEKELEAVA